MHMTVSSNEGAKVKVNIYKLPKESEEGKREKKTIKQGRSMQLRENS